MNKRLQDPQEAFNLPELLEDSLEEGRAKCIAFNAKGTLLAAGLDTGSVVIWDFETRSVARVIKICEAIIVGLVWSKDGRFLAAAGFDGTLALSNIETDTVVHKLQVQNSITGICLSQRNPKLCLVSFLNGVPHIADFEKLASEEVPIIKAFYEEIDGKIQVRQPQDGIDAVFDHKGDLIYSAMPKGFISIVSVSHRQIVDIIKVPQCSVSVIDMAMSRNGKHLLINYHDSIIRALNVNSNDLQKVLEAPSDSFPKPTSAEITNFQKSGSKAKEADVKSLCRPKDPLLTLGPLFQNRVEKSPWKCARYSSDTEFVAGASGVKNEYKIYLWTRWARLERVLEVKSGPRDGLISLVWHPSTNLLAAITGLGAIHLWAQVYKENWSAFAPDFTELQENEEYIEPEDIFDINPKPETNTDKANDDMDVDVDILTLDKDDECDSDGELISSYLHHLPVLVTPQEFDDKGKLVPPKTEGDEQLEPGLNNDLGISSTPAISELSGSEPGQSLGDGEVKQNKANKGKHRLANMTRPEESHGNGQEEDDPMLSD